MRRFVIGVLKLVYIPVWLRTTILFMLGIPLAANQVVISSAYQRLASFGPVFPSLQATLIHVCVVGMIVPWLAFTRPFTSYNHWWGYIVVAMMDVEATVLQLAAHRRTSLGSIIALDCGAIVLVRVIGSLSVRDKLRMYQRAAALVALCGATVILSIDASLGRLPGDFFCMFSVLCASLASVARPTLTPAPFVEQTLLTSVVAIPIAISQSVLTGESWAAVHHVWAPEAAQAMAIALGLAVVKAWTMPAVAPHGPIHLALILRQPAGIAVAVVVFGGSLAGAWWVVGAALIAVGAIASVGNLGFRARRSGGQEWSHIVQQVYPGGKLQ